MFIVQLSIPEAISTDKNEGVSKLALFSVVLGAVYMVIFVIELLGFTAALLQRLALVRLYAYGSLVALGLTVAGGIFQVVVHFTAKSDILKVCTDLTDGTTFAVYPFGFGGPSRHDTLDADDAASWCNDAYNRDSWQSIVTLLVTILLWGSFSVLAWGYYRQVLDPTSVANFVRPSRSGYPSHYNPPYNASVPNLPYNAPYGDPNPRYAPPPGPPPARDVGADGKPPGYISDGAPGYGLNDKENPFADFDEHTEHDVTSRPGPGARETF
ncbi:hypothetical protein GGX14DRAFT_658911 [Mycena pura]|uniref:Uncharacterized protein n=1 Tax=Mycena pura TaxID=153505 RepID=A0AAD6Y7Q6_9AGAR|nr:hypothetical protein GGX14DRAFT_658911 [Mycena pura]